MVEVPDDIEKMERQSISSPPPHCTPRYGSIHEELGDTCPTCRGIGRIPRGHEDQLVAVISCNDRRLKPKRTKLYVCISILLCLFLCTLILFFLFPRSIIITPVSVESVLVFFYPGSMDIKVTNTITLSNENFVPVDIVQFDVQAVVLQTVLNKTRVSNIHRIQSRSNELYTIAVGFSLNDRGLNQYCRSSSSRVHTLLVELQMTVNISYLSHNEQLSLETLEYLDCGSNSTTPHPVR